MRILIVGAGNTGRNLAKKLCEMQHDVVIVDPSQARLSLLEGENDVLTIVGSGCSPTALEQAEVDKADLLIAVSNRDEVNILACQLAHAAGVEHKVARVSDPALPHAKNLDWGALGVDLLISHKEEAAREIARILDNPGAFEIVELLDGRITVAGIRIAEGSPLLAGSLMEVREVELFNRLRFVGVVRGSALLVPTGTTNFEIGDEVYVAMRPEDLNDVLDWALPARPKYTKTVIAGGGDLGMELARHLDVRGRKTTLLEHNADRAAYCASQLHHVLILNGDATDDDTLGNAGISGETAFIAITGDEELNIVSCILANKMGAGFTLAQVGKPEYVPIIKTLSLLDRVVSPHVSMINAILHFVRGHNVTSAALLHRLPGEVLQINVPPGHRWTGKTIRDLKAPKGAVMVAALRDGSVEIPTGQYEICAGDQLVIFCQPETVDVVEKAFKK